MNIYTFVKAILAIGFVILIFWLLDMWADKAKSKRRRKKDNNLKVAKSNLSPLEDSLTKILSSIILAFAEYEKMGEENVFLWKELYGRAFRDIYREINVKNDEDKFIWIIESWNDLHSKVYSSIKSQGKSQEQKRFAELNSFIVKQLKRIRVLKQYNIMR